MTNREKYLDGLDNDELAYMISSYIGNCIDCPMIKEPEDISKCFVVEPSCAEMISKWLGEKS